jgi:hypothetical protein
VSERDGPRAVARWTPETCTWALVSWCQPKHRSPLWVPETMATPVPKSLAASRKAVTSDPQALLLPLVVAEIAGVGVESAGVVPAAVRKPPGLSMASLVRRWPALLSTGCPRTPPAASPPSARPSATGRDALWGFRRARGTHSPWSATQRRRPQARARSAGRGRSGQLCLGTAARGCQTGSASIRPVRRATERRSG